MILDDDGEADTMGLTRCAATNIFFTNGSQDPWRHASKQRSSPGGEWHKGERECCVVGMKGEGVGRGSCN